MVGYVKSSETGIMIDRADKLDDYSNILLITDWKLFKGHRFDKIFVDLDMVLEIFEKEIKYLKARDYFEQLPRLLKK